MRRPADEARRAPTGHGFEPRVGSGVVSNNSNGPT